MKGRRYALALTGALWLVTHIPTAVLMAAGLCVLAAQGAFIVRSARRSRLP